MACTSENEEDLGSIQPGTITKEIRVISFQTEVRPIIDANCAVSGCHNGDRSSIPVFDSDKTVQEEASAIRTEVISGAMPRGRKMSFEDRDILVSWINQGAELD